MIQVGHLSGGFIEGCAVAECGGVGVWGGVRAQRRGRRSTQ